MKQQKKRTIILIAAVLVLIWVFLWLGSPLQRTKIFLHVHGEELQQRILEAALPGEDGRIHGGQPMIPANIGIHTFNLWPGEHEMLEFLISAKGIAPAGAYYGCYYSYDDVPLAFQNANVTLIPAENGKWSWQGGGDNRGQTWKLWDHWYYFEASF